MPSSLTTISPQKWDVFMNIADAIIPPTTPENIREYLDPEFPPEKLAAYCRELPSTTPGFKKMMAEIIDSSPEASAKNFEFVLTALNNRLFAPALTGSIRHINDMTPRERARVVQSWKTSPLAPKRRLYSFFNSLVSSIWGKLSVLNQLAIGHEMKHSKKYDAEFYHPDEMFRFEMCSLAAAAGETYDVVISGSGSGAGVVASHLARSGYSVLVLEKGKYFHQSELDKAENEGFYDMYESGGTCATEDLSMTILAGATFGGGSTVNWSASLKTPEDIRHEWATQFNLPWFETEDFDKCCDYISEFMGVSDKHIEHSFSNQILYDGAEKLGYKVKKIPQNTGNQAHPCGMCHIGCRYGIKQGGVACWLKDAALHGCKFAAEATVQAIVQKQGRATGVTVCDNATGKTYTICARTVVVASGSLHTPLLMKRSGFKNKHIGKNLKLHPSTVVFGYFAEETRPFEKSIMTTVVTEIDNLDGKGHGPKIETILHSPILEYVFLPWINGQQFRQDLLKYKHLSALLLITRDEGAGAVTEDPKRPNTVKIDYVISKYDKYALQQGILKGADILYIQGALELIHPQAGVPRFVLAKVAHARTLADADYQKWRHIVERTPLDHYQTPYGCAHQMSSCRMSGNGPSQGAVDKTGRLFECKNVFVADTSVFPTASGVNPMISVMTIAHRIAMNVADGLKPSPAL
ncbi:hypothetical protein BABINDRAFT_159023 [Babjeviella inositovora NRRL Y-12698]|uniref:Long-chain-alcohol oxidase n=1 Tax=Babjeviella inositovora NRRL Y-12698 TaxID=984486 RepID=A0A1E3QZB3_9ASCO|nr:uncharacterized protein BABINDRAFT_159023 [Babjeviella inositovora NRRL Y-12698]ODQ82427.1 hypothetical protein BABINDRAFT_159023 [Babjeviella inositovora NRRL Y-12698]